MQSVLQKIKWIQSFGEENAFVDIECIDKIRKSNTDIRISFTYEIIVAKIYRNYKSVKCLFDINFSAFPDWLLENSKELKIIG